MAGIQRTCHLEPNLTTFPIFLEGVKKTPINTNLISTKCTCKKLNLLHFTKQIFCNTSKTKHKRIHVGALVYLNTTDFISSNPSRGKMHTEYLETNRSHSHLKSPEISQNKNDTIINKPPNATTCPKIWHVVGQHNTTRLSSQAHVMTISTKYFSKDFSK